MGIGASGQEVIRTCIAAALMATPAGAICRADQVEFRWDGGSARFRVEVADTEAERALGLMNRAALPKSEGMLFIYDGPQDVAFWMKNTLIPLDMIFITADGRVAKVHPDAVPGDLTPIPGARATVMVLEINGGLAGRIGLSAGAELRNPALDQSVARWPCE
jgi:uncharacterized protein